MDSVVYLHPVAGYLDTLSPAGPDGAEARVQGEAHRRKRCDAIGVSVWCE